MFRLTPEIIISELGFAESSQAILECLMITKQLAYQESESLNSGVSSRELKAVNRRYREARRKFEI